jgi:hypothetical protein
VTNLPARLAHAFSDAEGSKSAPAHRRPNGAFQELSLSRVWNRNVFDLGEFNLGLGPQCEVTYGTEGAVPSVLGDVLMVTRIDRLARSIGDLHDIVRAVKAKGASLKATEQPIDTSTAAGKCFLDMLGVFA